MIISDVFGLRLLREPAMRGAALATVVATVATFRVFQIFTLAREQRWAEDLAYYWTAGRQLLSGHSLYSAQQLVGPYAPEGQLGFLYPPPFAAVFVPAAALFPSDYRSLGWIWLAIGVAILLTTVLAIATAEGLDRPSRGLGGHTGRWLVLAALLFPPVIGELTAGNVHIELVGLLAVAWLGLRRGTARGDRVAGIAVGLATVIKVFPVLIILWLVIARRRTAFAWSLVGIVAAAVFTLPVTGIQAWLDYPTVAANMGAILDVHDSVSPTLWLEPLLGFSVARVVIVASAIAMIAYAGRRRPPTLGFAIAVTVSVLVAPAVFHHYLSLLVLPLLLGLAAGVRPVILLVVYFLLWGGQQPALGEWAWVLSRVPQTLGWVILLAALIRQQPKPEEQPQSPVARRASPLIVPPERAAT